ncbi:PepSY domain-containing protein [Janibacter limosus]|uniref:PepSY domain-containing protein n=1 Tax=Janibacter limosus TaxID=53458 RepID=A0A4P6MZL2_9MICO|nr:PepSY domain-containing protein [Janibacter limosus]QBF47193.1 hypothetical protein EXU32_13605 [Janibacter limosus]
MKTTRSALIALTTAALLGLSACGNADDPAGPAESRTQRPGDTPSASSSVASSTSSTSGSASRTSSTSSATTPTDPVLAAIAAAEKEAGGTAYEVDDQDGDGTWAVDVAKGATSIEVDVAKGGAASAGEEGDLDSDDRAGLKAATVDLPEAIETALKEVDGTFDGAELEEEGGKHSWKISIDVSGDDTDVLVDVRTGKATVERDG